LDHLVVPFLSSGKSSSALLTLSSTGLAADPRAAINVNGQAGVAMAATSTKRFKVLIV
jgi:hypothetical protein